MSDVWLADRTYTWLYELLDQSGRLVRTLTGAAGFAWTWDLDADTRGTGSLTVAASGSSSTPLDVVDDWEQYRLRVSYVLYPSDGSSPIVTPVAYAIPIAPRGASPRRDTSLTLVDVSNPLLTTFPLYGQSVCYGAGYAVTTALAELLTGALVSSFAITASTATLRADTAWEPGVPYSTITRELCDVAGFAKPYAKLGTLVLEPYVTPAKRPTSIELSTAPGLGIVDPDWTVALDDRPNRLTVTGRTVGTEGSVTDVFFTYREDTADAVRRGRWIVERRENVDAADLPTFTKYVDDLWTELRAPKETLTIKHLFHPKLWGNVNIVYRGVTWTVVKQEVAADSYLITTTARRVA
jgi:hypothetical protein